MDGIISAINSLTQGINAFVEVVKAYPWQTLAVLSIFVIATLHRRFKTARDFVRNMDGGYIVIDGNFGTGKTRMLTLLASEAKKDGRFVLSNFYNNSEFIRWNSKKDLMHLMRDLLALGEMQNFTLDDVEKAYSGEGKARVREKKRAILSLRRRFPNIPHSGFVSRFLLEGDEMQNIFFSRGHSENFSGTEGKPFLSLLHQIRHFNTLGAFALTDVGEFDRKFRRISSYYLTFGNALGGAILYYSIFDFITDKQNNFEIDKATKKTRVPIWAVNGYVVNRIIQKAERLIRHKLPRFAELGFFSKFNCDPDVDVYEPGSLFKKLETHYGSRPERFKFANPVE